MCALHFGLSLSRAPVLFLSSRGYRFFVHSLPLACVCDGCSSTSPHAAALRCCLSCGTAFAFRSEVKPLRLTADGKDVRVQHIRIFNIGTQVVLPQEKPGVIAGSDYRHCRKWFKTTAVCNLCRQTLIWHKWSIPFSLSLTKTGTKWLLTFCWQSSRSVLLSLAQHVYLCPSVSPQNIYFFKVFKVLSRCLIQSLS